MRAVRIDQQHTRPNVNSWSLAAAFMCRFGLMVVLLFFSNSLVVAQETDSLSPQVDDEIASLNKSDVESELTELKANTSLEEAKKETLQKEIESILDILSQAESFAASKSSFKAAIDQSPGNAKTHLKQLDELPNSERAAQVEPGQNSEQLRDQLDKEKVIFQSKDEQLKSALSDLTVIQSRPVENAARLPKVYRENSELQKQWGAIAKVDSTNYESRIERWEIQAKWIKNKSEIESIEQEQLSQKVREEELEAFIKLLTREVENSQAKVNVLTNLLTQGLTNDIDRIQLIAVSTKKKFPDDLDIVELSEEVIYLLEQFEAMVEAMQTADSISRRLKTVLDDIGFEYSTVKEELKFGNGGIEMAQVLYELQRRASSSSVPQDISYTVERSRLIWFEAKRKLREHPEIAKRLEDQPEKVKELVEARQELLTKQQTESANLTSAIGAIRADQLQYEILCGEIRQFVSAKLFGFEIRSCPVISTSSLTKIPSGLTWLANRDRSRELSKTFFSQTTWLLFAWVFIAIFVLFRGVFIRRLRDTSIPIRRISTDSYFWTFRAVLLTVFLALPIPVAWWSITTVFDSSQAIPWTLGFKLGLDNLFLFIAVSALIYASCRSEGLATKHFKWTKLFAQKLKQKIILLSVVYVPLTLLVHCFLVGEGAIYLPSVGRIAFILSQFWVVYQFVFKPFTVSTDRNDTGRDSAGSTFWLPMQTPIFVGIPLLLVGVASLGYVITALQLSMGLMSTAAIVLFFEFVFCLTKRWFDIRRRKLALDEALQKRQARMQAADVDQPIVESDEVLSLNEEEELGLDLGIARDQSEKILRLLFNLIVLLAVYRYWSDVIPLTAVLDEFRFTWLAGLSLLQIAKSAVILFVSVVLVRNLPGLLEFTVLRTSKIEAGTRNAIYTLCQYALGAISLVLLSNILQLDWTALGWMAAALSVGLGFGLQEIVANFVSGIIVLFERPIRVGDVVTLEGDTGTVTRINMRATTVTNWDRQDIIVPNKNLITGTILNWTLGAGLNRIVINVGVAYASNTDAAIQILLDVASEHPNVLDDPAPLASFEQFADSSKNLVLRAYLPNLDNRIRTISELHTEIAKRFNAADIEIPFPQQELHLPSGWNSDLKNTE